ncbi:MAG: PP2C family protein-serine/threonine phosphatase [Gemmataceae bacterium]
MRTKLIDAALSDCGLSRQVNEDRLLIERKMGLYAVIDGMGGSADGELAARLVVEHLPLIMRKHLRGMYSLASPRAEQRIRAALGELSSQIHYEGLARSGALGLGATIVLALAWETEVLIAHLGDSRAYLYRDGELEQLTKDHSPVQALIDRGELNPRDAIHHPSYGRLTRFLGMPGDAVADVRHLPLLPNDQLLLCSDGLTEMLSSAELTGIFALGLPPRETCQLLVDAAKLAGGADNITVLIVALINSEGSFHDDKRPVE